MSRTVIYLPVEEQPDLEIMADASTLRYMINRLANGADLYLLWVTDKVAPARPEDAPPNAEVFLYWSTGPTYPNSYVICSLVDYWAALESSGFTLDALAAAPNEHHLVARIPRTISQRETAIFMRWIDPATVGDSRP